MSRASPSPRHGLPVPSCLVTMCWHDINFPSHSFHWLVGFSFFEFQHVHTVTYPAPQPLIEYCHHLGRCWAPNPTSLGYPSPYLCFLPLAYILPPQRYRFCTPCGLWPVSVPWHCLEPTITSTCLCLGEGCEPLSFHHMLIMTCEWMVVAICSISVTHWDSLWPKHAPGLSMADSTIPSVLSFLSIRTMG